MTITYAKIVEKCATACYQIKNNTKNIFSTVEAVKYKTIKNNATESNVKMTSSFPIIPVVVKCITRNIHKLGKVEN